MKCGISVVILILCSSLAMAMQVPFSITPLQTEANLMDNLVRVAPEDQEPESLKTRAWLWQDETCLNVHFECEIDSTFFPGAISTRDLHTKADYLRVQLITIPTAFYSYLYMIYPTGNLVDGVRTVDALDYSFNSGYSYTTANNDHLWQVTVSIPLAELRFQQQLPYNWKVILTRFNNAADETFSQPFVITQMKKDYFTLAEDIQLSHPIKRKLDLAFKPYAVKSYDLITKTDSFDPDNVGLDVAFNPGQRTRIKLSFNPDFSDVPPDNAADIYNSKYPVYYSENRFFFAEDIDAFGIGRVGLYTRNIIKPKLAYKATGNLKRVNWGIMGALDKELSDEGEVINSDDFYSVLALIPNLPRLRLANALVSRMNSDYYNHVYSGNYRWDPVKDLTFTGTLYGSVKMDDREAPSDFQKGYLASAQMDAFPKEWHLSLYGTRISKDLALDAGYLWNTNYQKAGSSIAWDSKETKNYVSDYGFDVWNEYFDYLESSSSEQAWGGDCYINFLPQYGFGAAYYAGSELDMLENSHNYWQARVNASWTKWDKLSGSVQYGKNKTLVYSLLDAYHLDHIYLNIYGTLMQVLKYDLSGTLYSYDYPKDNLVDYGFPVPVTVKADNRYVIANGTLSYTPSRTLRLACGSGLSSYESDSVYANLSLYTNLRYEFKPGNFLYLGYNSRQLQDEKPTSADPLGHFRKNSSSAYVKVALTL